MEFAGINYSTPEVILLQETGLGVAELAARTCYDSFENSENDCVREFSSDNYLKNIDLVNNINSSDLLEDLAWVHHHHSIIEHTNLSFLVRGTSRGVLQEHSRHRIQSLSVRSTRYTMSSVINAFVSAIKSTNIIDTSREWFIEKVNSFNMFVTTDDEYNYLEISSIFNKLHYQMIKNGEVEFMKLAVSKSSLELGYIDYGVYDNIFNKLETGKKKRNIGDAFKHIVSDNWKVDMVVTMNLRSLKNYFNLRDSGAAYFQIRELAKEMKKVTPDKYLKLISKEHR